MRTSVLFVAMINVWMLSGTAQEKRTGTGAPSGAHFNLNIIGQEQAKTAPMTGTSRHTIFVALGKAGVVTSKIYLVRGASFEVCDGNAADAAKDCSGQQIQSVGAVFQLPCNTRLSATSVDLVPCDEAGATASYSIYIKPLGKPGGSMTTTTCATDKTTNEEVCSTENVVTVRSKGGQKFQDVTNELTSIVANIDDDPQMERVALFHDPLKDWFWNVANQGLRLSQLRFYLN
jgi:hypothetical protein